MVEYLNTIPFRYGFKDIEELVKLDLKIPRLCGEEFFNGNADLALVPVGSWIANGLPYNLITDYCIGAHGAVGTVNLYSDEKIENVSKIYLDNHSKTSNLLVEVLCKYYYKIEVEFSVIDVADQKLKKHEAKLMIGDKVFNNKQAFKYTYDLAEEWYKFKKAPFVFAVWLAKPTVDPSLVEKINDCFKLAFSNLPQIIKEVNDEYPTIDLDHYYSSNISYNLDKAKRKALNDFINLVQS